MRWPKVALGEVAEPVARPIAPQRDETYRFVGVKWWGEGVYEFARKTGTETAASALFRVEADDLIINKIWARHGSIGVVPPDLAGAVGSNEFPTFRPKAARLLPRWVHWWSKSRAAWDACAGLSFGSSGKNRIKPAEFLRIPIPLPPLAEQERIVRRLDAVQKILSDLARYRVERDAECTLILRAMMSDKAGGTPTPMRELVRFREPDVTVDRSATYEFAGVYSFGRGVFRAGAKSGMDFAYPRLTRLRAGDFTYPKLMAWEGALGIVPPECDGCVVSPEFPVFEVRRDCVLPEVLDLYFRDPRVWPSLAGASTGTNARRRRLNPRDFLEHRFPLPSRDTQIKIAEAYRLVAKMRERDKSIEAETSAILSALLAEAFGDG